MAGIYIKPAISAQAKFVSYKINKIRWRPTPGQSVEQPSVFATGGWDEETTNSISLWNLPDCRSTQSILSDDCTTDFDTDPQLLCSNVQLGDVTGLQFVFDDSILTSSSTGDVTLFKYDQEIQSLNEAFKWSKLHFLKSSSCSCTAVACSRGDEMFVSVGEDGRIVLVNLGRSSGQNTVIEPADSCTLNAVCFLQQTTISTVNSVGQFKIWDIRQSTKDPTKVLVLTGEHVPLHCMDQHPTQPHIVATGGQDGNLYIWDMRQEKTPVTVHQGHTSDMWEVHFHPTHPDNLFTCSNDGSLWHWYTNESALQGTNVAAMISSTAKGSMSRSGFPMLSANSSSDLLNTSAWLMDDGLKRHLEISDLLCGNTMPVNSLDISANMLLCGTDGEQLCVLNNLGIC